jgi:type VI secretion system secreted protein VgrG
MSSGSFAAGEPLSFIGPPGVDGLHLQSLVAWESLGIPFQLELLVTSEAELTAAQVLGQPVTVSVNVDPLPERNFNGLVAELAFRGGDAKSSMYRLLVRPWLWFLSRATDCRIFQQKTIPDILKQVFRGHGFSDFEEALQGQYDPREYVVQYRESDLNFVSRLMQDAGIYYYFKHTKDTHTLVLCDSLAAHEPNPGYETLPFRPEDRQRQEHVDHIDHWHVTSRVETIGLSTTDFNFEQPLADLSVRRNLPAKFAQSAFESYDYPGGYTTMPDGDARLRVRLEEQEAQLERASGHSNSRGIVTGKLLSLEEHPLAGFNREYLIISSTLRVENHDLASGAGAHGPPSCEFTAQDSSVSFRSVRAATKPLVHGAQTAVVVGPEGEEIWTDKYGRVKVKFHWDRSPDANENSSCWIRVSQLWAGSGFGGMHLPRIGQEVIVEFLEGDPDYPIVTGRVYNGLNATPYELPKHLTVSCIKSHTSKDGRQNAFNELRFEDAKGAEEVYIHAERDKNVEVRRNRSAKIDKDDSVTVGGNRSVEVTGNLEVRVGKDGGVYKLDASDSITMTAPNFILLKCGDSSLRIEPDSITITSGKKSKLVLDADITGTSSGGSTLVLDANAQATSSGKATLRLDQNVHAESSAAATLVLNSNAAMQGAAIQVRSAGVFDVKVGQVKLNQ